MAAGEESALEDADAAGLAGLAAVGRLLEGKDTFKRRPRERVNAPTQDQSGRPLPEHIVKRNRRCCCCCCCAGRACCHTVAGRQSVDQSHVSSTLLGVPEDVLDVVSP